MRRIFIGLLALSFTAQVQAFEVDGLHSGMSPAEVAAVANNRGLEAWEYRPGMWSIGIRAEARIDAMFSVCPPAGMVAYSKNMDADSEYVPTVERSMNMWGQPKVLVRRMPWPGPGGGETQDVTMLWRQGTTEITVSFTPEGRDGKGALRYNRTASIAYVDKARVCGTK